MTTVAVDIESDAERILGEIEDNLELKREEKLELADGALRMIQAQTDRGLDMWGDPFAPYSEEYLEFLENTGRETTVDLLLEGHMRASGTSGGWPVSKEVGELAVTITFTSEREKMKAMGHHRGLGNLPERPWFNVPEGTERHEKLLDRALDMIVQRIEQID